MGMPKLSKSMQATFNRKFLAFPLGVGLLWCTAFLASAQSVQDYAVRVSAVVQTNPPSITLTWPANSEATNCIRYRKMRDATSWGVGTSLATNATNYVDTNVSIGSAYEYRISRTARTGTNYYSSEGYIYAGIEAPLVESRGKVVLVVDDAVAPSLTMELARLQLDLVGDGWTVLRHDVARNDTVPNIKAIIKGDYTADPANVKAVFLFGHVPVPYSGDINPDGHPNHLGAWPADVYYAEMNSTWTDSVINDTSASDPRNRNIPGDGKFDYSGLPSAAELQVGRVDLSDLPAFPQSELELLRQYLNKDHNFRHAFITAERRGLIDDHFGTFGGEAFAANGWRVFAPMFGDSNTFAGDWLTTLANQSYLWGYGCGGGTYTSASGVASTTDLAHNDPRVVFTMVFGSYFGDWDSPNNFLRAQLATVTYTLASAWAGRPFWMFHHMALGETIGFSTRLTQNNLTTYAANLALGWVHIALMGDPTLRLHPVAPPSALAIVTNGLGGVQLSWNNSPDAIVGYHVYRAATTDGPFTRLTSLPITTTNYTDPLVSSNVYMVRAVKLEVSASGSYYNPSQGIFQSLDPTIATPAITLDQPTNNATFLAPINLRLAVGIFDPANTVTNVTFYTNGIKMGESAAPPFSLIWSNAPLGVYSILAQAACANGFVTNSDPMTVTVDNGGAPRLFITALGNGSNLITGAEVLGRAYRLQYVPELTSTNWQTLGTVSNLPDSFEFMDSVKPTQRFYRVILMPTPPVTEVGIESISQANGVVTIVWGSVAGQTYRVMYKNSVTDATWADLPPDVVATGPTTSKTDKVGNIPQRFYRTLYP
jgi:Bacterial Ig domain